VVCPAYNEAGNVAEFLSRVEAALDKAAVAFEIIFAVDPSTDGTEGLIKQEHARDRRIKMLRLSRRFGQPAATLAGIEHASGDAVIIMDADLQDPPEVIPEMVALWRAGSRIVLARRSTRTGEPMVKRAVARGGYAFLNRFSEVPIPENTGDFRLLDRGVVRELLRYPESGGFLRGLVALVGFESDTVYFDRPDRHAGKTHYNSWLGSLKIGFNGVVGFSTALLNLSTLVGLLSAGLALLISIAYVVAKVAGVDFPLGNTTIVVTVLFMGGLNLISIGVMGLYVSRIYDEVRGRPRYIVSEVVGSLRVVHG
jgi:dolichol-phosphate mannosyltransferase